MAGDLPSTMILIDGGTTNTRAWLVVDGVAVARSRTSVGVRDVARGASSEFDDAVGRTVRSLSGQSRAVGPSPRHAIVAGMIASDLGLGDVPHIDAPAGAPDLASGTRWVRHDALPDLDILLVPGVRTGGMISGPDEVSSGDVMRGEETLCLGLMDSGLLRPGGVLLNLGSHWKVVTTDAVGRVAGSVTALSGELMHAAQERTILASSVPPEPPRLVDRGWFEAGGEEARRSGVARALFCVRLLHQRCEGTAEQRLSFLLGAIAADALDPLLTRGVIGGNAAVSIAGAGPVGAEVAHYLGERGITAAPLDQEAVEQGMVSGLYLIARTVFGPPA